MVRFLCWMVFLMILIFFLKYFIKVFVMKEVFKVIVRVSGLKGFLNIFYGWVGVFMFFMVVGDVCFLVSL